MKYGLIGEKLGHSYSADIHKRLGNEDYTLLEIERDGIERFFKNADFLGINVTIPYKETVIPYISYIDSAAKDIGAVNTVVNKNGRLMGYNTDAFGMEKLIEHAGIDMCGRKVAVLGTGGTSKTAIYVAKKLGADKIVTVSRRASVGSVSYDELYTSHSDTEIIINTTPVGMYPNTDASAVDISRFHSLVGVIDAIYNPLRTKLITDAEKRGIKSEGGLYMLVAQAVRASEIFFDITHGDELINRIYREIKRKKENIVLIGMPASGKSTVGRILSEALGFDFLDTDREIEKIAGASIPEIFTSSGEGAFRNIESEAIKAASLLSGTVIATGGGAVLREDNTRELRKNGRIFFLDRSPELLVPTVDRPLSSDRESIMKRYSERYSLYCASADVKINADGTPEEIVQMIMEKLG